MRTHAKSTNIVPYQPFFVQKLIITIMKFTILATLLSSAVAFAPQSTGRVSTAVNSDELNGWVPNESEFAWGLPGSIGPIEEFDPLGFAKDTPLGTMLQWREAEVQHGRVAMLAVLGMFTSRCSRSLIYCRFISSQFSSSSFACYFLCQVCWLLRNLLSTTHSLRLIIRILDQPSDTWMRSMPYLHSS